METVKSVDDIGKLEKNNIVGNYEFDKSNITFKGNDNILYCEGTVKLVNANFTFDVNNSIVYLSSA